MRESQVYVFSRLAALLLSFAVTASSLAQSNPERPLGKVPLPELRKLAEAGDGPARAELGERYLFGMGVKEDLKEARRWFLLAAEKGVGQAMEKLGGMDRDGLAAER